MLKRALLIGILLVILAAVPITIAILQTTKTNTQSNAAQATTFSFSVPSGPVTVGQTFNVPIVVNPTNGTNSNKVSFVKITFTFDGNILASGSGGLTTDTGRFTVLEQPPVTCNSTNLCTASITLSVGNSASNVISTQTTVATMSFTALTPTNSSNPTQLSFVSGQNQALSVASSDQPAENVFSSGQSGSIVVIGAGGTTPTGTGTGGGGGSTGGVTPGGGGGTSGGGGGNAASNLVKCDSLTADVASGEAPLTVVFTATGSATQNPISLVNFNFGDGQVDSATTSATSESVSTQISHIYHDNGTFTASATMTDTQNNVSDPSQCTQTINVGNVIAQNPTATPVPTIAKTGPGDTYVKAGILGVITTILGVALVAIF